MYMQGLSHFETQTEARAFLEALEFRFVEMKDEKTTMMIGTKHPYDGCTAMMRPVAPRHDDPWGCEIVFLTEKPMQPGQPEYVG